MRVTFHTGANARFPQSCDGRPRIRRWAVLVAGRETIHVDLGWADDPDSIAREHELLMDLGRQQ